MNSPEDDDLEFVLAIQLTRTDDAKLQIGLARPNIQSCRGHAVEKISAILQLPVRPDPGPFPSLFRPLPCSPRLYSGRPGRDVSKESLERQRAGWRACLSMCLRKFRLVSRHALISGMTYHFDGHQCATEFSPATLWGSGAEDDALLVYCTITEKK